MCGLKFRWYTFESLPSWEKSICTEYARIRTDPYHLPHDFIPLADGRL
jgi:hypothetical protein